MKLIIEHSSDGVYFYEETERHHRAAEQDRTNQLTKRTLDDLDEDCRVEEGEYMVIDLVKVASKQPR